MGVNKVEANGETLVDLTNDTVTPETLAEGVTAHDASGEQIVGTMSLNKVTDLTGLIYNVPSGWKAQSGYGAYVIDYDVLINGQLYTDLYAIHIGYTYVEPLALGGELGGLPSIPTSPQVDSIVFAKGDTFIPIDTSTSFEITIKGGAHTTQNKIKNWFFEYGKLVSGSDIDTSNLTTLDKVNLVDTNMIAAENITDEGDGIYWENQVTFYGESGSLHDCRISQKIPLVAGKNVTLSYDEENNAIAINATGGGSTPSVSGNVLVFNDNLVDIVYGTHYFDFEFTHQGETKQGRGIQFQNWGGSGAYMHYMADSGEIITVCTRYPAGEMNNWNGEEYKKITVGIMPTDETILAILQTNTTVQDASSSNDTSSNGLEMPQIRFTSAEGTSGYLSAFFVYGDQPLKLTVEIVGGGPLQAGDQLQVCTRRKFKGSLANGYRNKYKLQRFAEYVVTDEDLDKRYLTLSIFCTEDRGNVYRGLFRDGNASGISPLYLRLRRPKGDLQSNNSGQSVDADFSNIVTIWKHHMRGEYTIRID